MQICYIVNSSGEDFHADLAYVSARFMRRVNPGARLFCITDIQSGAALRQRKHPLLATVDRMVEVDVPAQSAMAKNRWLKSRLRQWVDGDFLYVDSDTVCIADVASLFDASLGQPFDIAVARDVNVRGPAESRRQGDQEFWPQLRELGWRSSPAGYFNAGVILVRDTPGARRLCQRWGELWDISRGTGPLYDQPAFNEAIRQTPCAVKVLHRSYNAMILAKPRLVFTAKIVHLFASVPGAMENTPFFQLVREVHRGGNLPGDAIDAVLADPFHWMSRNALLQHCWSKSPLVAMRIMMERFVRTGDLGFKRAI